MLKKLTWLDLLAFLQDLKDRGELPSEDDVMLHNLETDDEYPCDVFEVDNKLVMSINWDIE
tara:strand:- start:14336 stop:14518 length:183 start_codon:yes stop_codon:yes gene_type:complete